MLCKARDGPTKAGGGFLAEAGELPHLPGVEGRGELGNRGDPQLVTQLFGPFLAEVFHPHQIGQGRRVAALHLQYAADFDVLHRLALLSPLPYASLASYGSEPATSHKCSQACYKRLQEIRKGPSAGSSPHRPLEADALYILERARPVPQCGRSKPSGDGRKGSRQGKAGSNTPLVIRATMQARTLHSWAGQTGISRDSQIESVKLK